MDEESLGLELRIKHEYGCLTCGLVDDDYCFMGFSSGIAQFDKPSLQFVKYLKTGESVTSMARLKNNFLLIGENWGFMQIVKISDFTITEWVNRGNFGTIKEIKTTQGDDEFLIAMDEHIKLIKVTHNLEIIELNSFDAEKEEVFHSSLELEDNKLAIGTNEGVKIVDMETKKELKFIERLSESLNTA